MKQKNKVALLFTLAVFAFVLLGLIVRNIQFSHLPFNDWDEALYAQSAVEILQNKSLVTTFNGHLWFNKPPLTHALLALMFSTIGQSEFLARFIMLKIGFLLLVLLYFLGRSVLSKLFQKEISKLAPLQREFLYLAPVLITASSGIFLEKSTFLNSDIVVAVSWVGFFLFVSIYSLKLIFLLFGVLSKSVFGFYPLVIEALTVLKKDWTRQNVLKVALLAFFSLFWYGYNYIRFGNYFIRDHFFDQILKRIVVPIELHFGGKFYYFEYLWKDLNFINVLFIAGYTVFLFDLYKIFRKKGLRIREDRNWWQYLILLSPLPFLAFLIVVKTKLYWYLMMAIPFFALIVPYLVLRHSKAVINVVLFLLLAGFFLFRFVPQTYQLQTQTGTPDKVALAKCLSQKPGKTVAFLTEQQERKNQNFLEAAHYDTVTSFFYGGSPAFVYYSQKRIEFFYNVQKFINEYSKYDIAVLPRESLTADPEIASNVLIYEKVLFSNDYCRTQDWFAFPK